MFSILVFAKRFYTFQTNSAPSFLKTFPFLAYLPFLNNFLLPSPSISVKSFLYLNKAGREITRPDKDVQTTLQQVTT